jgi:hypothetical protein
LRPQMACRYVFWDCKHTGQPAGVRLISLNMCCSSMREYLLHGGIGVHLLSTSFVARRWIVDICCNHQDDIICCICLDSNWACHFMPGIPPLTTKLPLIVFILPRIHMSDSDLLRSCRRRHTPWIRSIRIHCCTRCSLCSPGGSCSCVAVWVMDPESRPDEKERRPVQ